MTQPVQLPETFTRAGQRLEQPTAADAVLGLILVATPPLALVACLSMRTDSLPGAVLLLLAAAYAGVWIVVVRGFWSDASPWRVRARETPLGACVAALVLGFALVWGAVFTSLPDAPSAVAQTEARITAAQESATSASESAASAGEDATLAPVAPASSWESFLATGAQGPIGLVALGAAGAAFGYLVVSFERARRAQRRAYPPPGPFDVPNPPTR